MSTLEAALALSRLGFYVAATVLFGTQCLLGFLAPAQLGARLGAVARTGLQAASIIAVLASILWLFAEAALAGGGWSVVLTGATLDDLLLSTSTGQALLVRTGLSIIVMAAFVTLHGAERLKAAFGAVLLGSLSLSGHARMDNGFREVAHLGNHVIHLLSAGFWFGALAILPACLARLSDPELGGAARATLRRFSAIGHLAVALVVTTGIVNAVLIFDGWPTGSTLYQALLLFKVALVAVMVGIAMLNRYVFVPRMRVRPNNAIADIRLGTYAELAFGMVVLALVAAFGIMDPT
ncbi:copper homeostasis membrane protein CopD [Bosea beijingensis]